MTTLYVTDLDGTLMRTDKTLSRYTLETVNRLIDEGMVTNLLQRSKGKREKYRINQQTGSLITRLSDFTLQNTIKNVHTILSI